MKTLDYMFASQCVVGGAGAGAVVLRHIPLSLKQAAGEEEGVDRTAVEVGTEQVEQGDWLVGGEVLEMVAVAVEAVVAIQEVYHWYMSVAGLWEEGEVSDYIAQGAEEGVKSTMVVAVAVVVVGLLARHKQSVVGGVMVASY